MNTAECELSILVARPDVNFMAHTVSHLVTALRFPFVRRVLVIDIAPLSGHYRNRTDIPSLAALRNQCDELIRGGIVDEAKEIDYSATYRRGAYRKHLGGDAAITHDTWGYPVLGSIFSIEQTKSQYMVHFDCDMLLYQSPAFNWIAEGIKLLQDYEDVVSVLPLSGPPTKDGSLHQTGFPYERDGRGFFRFKFFTSRCFLIDRQRFAKLLPLKLSRYRLIDLLPAQVLLSLRASLGRGLSPWESMVSWQLEKSSYVRADLDNPGAWTLHPPDHGPEFIAHLPEILKKVERGSFPAQQAGHYDLRLADWLS